MFDGYPRNSAQADELDSIANVDLVIYLNKAIDDAIKELKDKISISYCLAYKKINKRKTNKSINKNDLPHIFERFYKGNNNSDNVGIGLSISKKIIEMQKGKIEVHDLDNTSFVIKLYK